MAKKQTFKDRLTLLMGEDKPYTWARKIGIEKGLFQYYWQREKIPTYNNLLKIQAYSGCSLDWLLTGRRVDMDSLDEISGATQGPGRPNVKLNKSLSNVKAVYRSKDLDDIALLEGILTKMSPSGKGRK